MPYDLAAFRAANVERACQLSAFIIVVYEYLGQFSNEVDFFWRKRWSIGKVLFLWSRYYSLAYNLASCIVFINPHPSFKACLDYFIWNTAGLCIQVVTTHLILELRLWAMYGSKRKFAAFFAALTCLEIIGYGAIFSTHPPDLTLTNNPAPGLFICADGDRRHGHLIAFGWTIGMSVDAVLLALTLFKTWQHAREGKMHGGLMQLLTRDQTLFFFPIFGLWVANQTIWLVNHVLHNELATGFAVGLSAVLAHRLMISVRQTYYARSLTETVSVTGMLPTIRVTTRREPEPEEPAREEEEPPEDAHTRELFEMNLFNNRQGV